MKKIVVIFTMLLALNLTAIEIETNDLHVLGGIDFSNKDKIGSMNTLIPGLTYEFEGGVNDKLSFFFESELGFSMSTSSFDGDYADYSEKVIYLGLNPSLEYSLFENSTFSLALPLALENISPAIEDAEFEMGNSLNLESGVDYSTLEEDIEGTSPWASFEEGYSITLQFGMGLFEKVGDETADEKDMTIGTELAYSYFNKKNLFMIKPSVTLAKHLNNKVSEAIEIETALSLNKDLGKLFSTELAFAIISEKADSEADLVNGFDLNLTLLYYPIDGLELSVFTGFDKGDFSDSDEKMNIRYGLGLDYEIFAK